MKRYQVLVFALCLATPIPAPAHASGDLLSIYQGYQGDTLSDINTAHRSADELGNWLSDVTAEALNIAPRDASRKLSSLRPKFSDQGYKAYVDFLTKMGFADSINAQTLSLTAIVNSAPVLIGQGASAGRYAWAFELPVVLSSRTPAQPQLATKTVTLRIQMGRSAKAADPIGVLIENWQEYVEPPKPAPSGGDADGSGKPDATP